MEIEKLRKRIDSVLEKNRFCGVKPKNYKELAEYLGCNRITFYKMFDGVKCSKLEKKIVNWLNEEKTIYEHSGQIIVAQEEKLKEIGFELYEDGVWISPQKLGFENEDLKIYWCVDQNKVLSLVVRDYIHNEEYKYDNLGFLLKISQEIKSKA